GRPLRLGWSDPNVIEAFEKGSSVLVYCAAPRITKLSDAREPPSTAPVRPRARVGQLLPGHMLLHDTEQRLAVNTGDPNAARVHEAWIARAQEGLRLVLAQPGLRVTNDRGGL